MDTWNEFNESVPLEKDKKCSEVIISSISHNDLKHGEKAWNTFKIRNLGEYHDLYVQSNHLLLTDVFEAFRKTCIKEYELGPAYFVSLPGFAWTVMLRVTGVELELLTDKDMLLMFEEGTRGGISQAIHKYEKADNKYMKCYNKNALLSFIQYLDETTCMDGLCVKNFLLEDLNGLILKNMLEKRQKITMMIEAQRITSSIYWIS